MGSSQRGRVTRLSGRASGRPPGPPVLAPWLVVLPQAASRPSTLEKATAAPALRSRKPRLLREFGRSFGWCVIRVPSWLRCPRGGTRSHGQRILLPPIHPPPRSRRPPPPTHTREAIRPSRAHSEAS